MKRSIFLWVFAFGGALGCTPSGRGPSVVRIMVSGTNLGMVDVDGDGDMDGVGYDSDGDGRVDELDLDGDGVSDGEDIDGDGRVTVWSEQGTGNEEPDDGDDPANAAVDPDFEQRLDPEHLLGGANPSNGEVTIGTTGGITGDANTLPSMNQGRQSSCTAFAVAAAATITRHRREGGTIGDLWASPSFIYSRILADLGRSCNVPTPIARGLDLLVREGAATLSEVPYESARDGSVCADNPQASMPAPYRIGGWQEIWPYNRTAILESLSAGRPVLLSVKLSTNFFAWRGRDLAADAVFSADGLCTQSTHCGGHAMLIVGYDKDKSAYRVLNSWGSDFGNRGYMWWDFDNLDARPGVAAFTITNLPEAPAALEAPNPDGFTARVVGGTVLTQRENPRTHNMFAQLALRLSFSEPAKLTRLQITPPNGAEHSQTYDRWLTYGDVTVGFNTGVMPQQGMAPATLSLTLRDGTTITRELQVPIPAPEGDSDGQD